MFFGLVPGRRWYHRLFVASVCVIVLGTGAVIAQRRVPGQLRSPSSPSAAPPAGLYGTRAGNPLVVGVGELYKLNPANGALLQDIGPTNMGGTNVGITGLAFHPTTQVLYGSTSNKSSVRALVTIDPLTAQVTLVGPFNVVVGGNPVTMADIAFDSAGNLYGVSSGLTADLYTINIATGAATIVGTSGILSTTGGGIAINSSGVAYSSPTDVLFGTFDRNTGAFNFINNPGLPLGAGSAYSALAFNPANSLLYGINLNTNSPFQARLVTLNTSTAAATDLGATVTSLDAIAFTPAGTTAANVAVSGRVVSATGSGVRGAAVTLNDGVNTRTAITNAFGYYSFKDIPTGRTYLVNASVRRYTFTPRVISLTDQLTNVDLVALW